MLILATAGLIFLEATKPVPISWFPSYYQESSLPLGTSVLYQLMESEPGKELQELNRPPYELLKENELAGSYFFLNDYINFDETEADLLLDWVSKGNQVFVAAKSPGEQLLDSLGLEIETAFLTNSLVTEPMMELVNPEIAEEEPRHLDRDVTINFFSEIENQNHRVLGRVQPKQDTLAEQDYLPNFISIYHGEGELLFHLQPEVFSNYFLLEQDNYHFSERVLSYISKENEWLWDGYYKNGKPLNISPLKQILDTRSLKWAYYLMLIGIVIYVLFQGKRRQRPIPVIAPPVNKTFEFTQTIAGVYWDRKAFKEIAEKQISLFLEYIRLRLRIPTEKRDALFIRQLTERSGNNREDTEKLFKFIEQIESAGEVTEQDLIKLNRNITQFKSSIDGKS